MYISADKSEQEFRETYAKMPWISQTYNHPIHQKLREKFCIEGVPMIFVADAKTGFIITKKGRKDICDLGVSCMKNWEEEEADMLAKVQHLTEGYLHVEDVRMKKEEEEN